MKPERALVITTFSADGVACHRGGLASLLHACVHDGASIGFVSPFSIADADGFWLGKVLPGMRDGALMLLAAQQDERIVGSVQLDCDTPPNQPHRAEVRKLLVHPEYRRRGIARVLMTALEGHAGQLGRTLLTLDTRIGDNAGLLYASLGYQVAGVIPGYCRHPFKDRLDPTTLMYKAL